MAFEYNCSITKIIDGDTIDVILDLGFNTKLDKRIRVHGIDTPELRSRLPAERIHARMARSRVQQLLPLHTKHIIRTYKPDKYGRTLGTIYDDEDNDIADILVQERLAVKYHGQNKQKIQEEHRKNRIHHGLEVE